MMILLRKREDNNNDKKCKIMHHNIFIKQGFFRN